MRAKKIHLNKACYIKRTDSDPKITNENIVNLNSCPDTHNKNSNESHLSTIEKNNDRDTPPLPRIQRNYNFKNLEYISSSGSPTPPSSPPSSPPPTPPSSPPSSRLRPHTPPGAYPTFLKLSSFNPSQYEIDIRTLSIFEILFNYKKDIDFKKFVDKKDTLDLISEVFRLEHAKTFDKLLQSFEFRYPYIAKEGMLYRNEKDTIIWAIKDNNFYRLQLEIEKVYSKRAEIIFFLNLLKIAIINFVANNGYKIINWLALNHKLACTYNDCYSLLECAVINGALEIVEWTVGFAKMFGVFLSYNNAIIIAKEKNNKSVVRLLISHSA